jgi:hypothetical protein
MVVANHRLRRKPDGEGRKDRAQGREVGARRGRSEEISKLSVHAAPL